MLTSCSREHGRELGQGAGSVREPGPAAPRRRLAPVASRPGAAAPASRRRTSPPRRAPDPRRPSRGDRPAGPRTDRSPPRSRRGSTSRIWLQSAGFDDARRVRSRNPPAASSRMSGSSASSVAARPISAVDATCGRWLTNATSRSCRSGDMRMGRPPIRSTHASSDATARASAPPWGVRTHTMPSTSDADACSGPERSEPPMGWPPTNRAASAPARAATSRTTGPLMLPASVTIASGAAARARADQCRDRAARARRPPRCRLPATASSSDRASPNGPLVRPRAAASLGRRPTPTTSHPTREEAIAIEVPIRPVPTIATRSGAVEVIA